MRDKVFVDSDICLDLLQERTPFFKDAIRLFNRTQTGEVDLYISATIFANLHYLIRKGQSLAEVRKILGRLRLLVKILPVDEKVIDLSLHSDFTDFEDAIQYYTAIENGIRVIVTRNLKDYKHAQIPVMTPQAYLKATI
ncbi:MAG: PIN domain-containing protein [Cytophagia bacterium]|nr:PIN domain-containing protein [Cytophagia bacterium]NBW36538.1 PIN domain-containing protein [Cytophagia bacterium]